MEAQAAWTCPTCGVKNPHDFAVCPRDATPRAEGRTPSADPMIGAVLARTYRITRVLGEGGMARLYEAEHLRIESRFAVKAIHEDLARDADLLTRFEREARAAARIHSEHVVRLVDVLRTPDDRPCMVTELLEGEDLQHRLDRKGKLSVAEAIPIARQLCRAVAAAHAVGVIHRDLKPANVFLCKRPDEDDLVKVLDFGVAKLGDDERITRTDAVMGTAAYMAPEQARRALDASPLADVYSLGAVLYHMLAGQPPYGNVPAVSRFALVLHEEPARPSTIEPSIPPGIESVIQHAMARDKAARIASAHDLDDKLAAFEAPRPAEVSVVRASTVRTTAAHAVDITVRARFARPVAVLVAIASSLATGAWLAALLATTVSPTNNGERALIGILATVGTALVAAYHIRALHKIWRSIPAVTSHTAAPARALFGGVIVLGALELLSFGLVTAQLSPLRLVTRVIAAGLAASLGLAWRRIGLYDRFLRRIG